MSKQYTAQELVEKSDSACQWSSYKTKIPHVKHFSVIFTFSHFIIYLFIVKNSRRYLWNYTYINFLCPSYALTYFMAFCPFQSIFISLLPLLYFTVMFKLPVTIIMINKNFNSHFFLIQIKREKSPPHFLKVDAVKFSPLCLKSE